MSEHVIRVRPPARPRKPTAPRTCCPTHRDTCNFGRDHLWSGPFRDPLTGEWSHPEDFWCATCGGICTGDRTLPDDAIFDPHADLEVDR